MKIYAYLLVLFLSLSGSVQQLHASLFTSWTEDPSDPIYNPFPGSTLYDDYFPCVLFNANKFNGDGDAVFYKMWHQGSGVSTGNLALSTSNDGINWTLKGETNLVAPSGLDIGHPCVLYDPNGFGGGSYHYKMWFWNGTISSISAIQYTLSMDGFTWTTPIPVTQDLSFPLIDGVTGSYFYQLYGPGFVIYNPAATSTPGQPYTFPYVMFFDAAGSGFVPGNAEQEAIALAYSVDGIFWTRYGSQPVLIPSGNASDWDGIYSFRPSVIKVNGVYHMFYSGSNGSSSAPYAGHGLGTGVSLGSSTPFAHGLGTASSTDGINWLKDPANPIFINTNGVPWRSDRTYTPVVLFGTFTGTTLQGKMWFVGGDLPYTSGQAIGYATLQNFVPTKPRHFRGKYWRSHHLKHDKNFVLKTKWRKSRSSNVAFYRVYENGKVIKKIPKNKRLHFKKHIFTSKHLFTRYTVTAVSVDGFESTHTHLHAKRIFPHHHQHHPHKKKVPAPASAPASR